MNKTLPNLIEALRHEVAAIRQRGGGTQIGLRGGEYIGSAEGSFLYRFVVTEELNLRDETPVRMTVENQDIQGTLVSFRNGVLIVSAGKMLGDKIASATLVAQDSFLLERLVERLQKVLKGDKSFNLERAEQIFTPGAWQVSNKEPRLHGVSDEKMNPSQEEAVLTALGSNTTFIWGPPGTGKTTTLARIVEEHYRAGRSVLLVSNTNIAVDTAVECIAERLKGETAFHRGLVIRMGPVVKEDLDKEFGNEVIFEKVLSRLARPLLREEASLKQQAQALEEKNKHIAETLKIAAQHKAIQKKIRVCSQVRSETLTRSISRAEEAERYAAEAKVLRDKHKNAMAMGVIRRFFFRTQTRQDRKRCPG